MQTKHVTWNEEKGLRAENWVSFFLYFDTPGGGNRNLKRKTEMYEPFGPYSSLLPQSHRCTHMYEPLRMGVV